MKKVQKAAGRFILANMARRVRFRKKNFSKPEMDVGASLGDWDSADSRSAVGGASIRERHFQLLAFADKGC